MPTTLPSGSGCAAMSDVIVSCRIYIAGQAPNSRYAVQNLTEFCRKHLPNRHEIEIVDVYVDPARAAVDRVFLTPTLVIVAPPPSRSIIGDLSDGDVLRRALSSEIAESDNRPASG